MKAKGFSITGIGRRLIYGVYLVFPLDETDVDAATRNAVCAKDQPEGVCMLQTHDQLITLAHGTAAKPVRDPAPVTISGCRRQISSKMSKNFLRVLLFIAVTLVTACDGGRERANVLTAHGEQEVVVMDFSAPFPLDPLPAGWYHRTF
jgi:hypothetical protein